MFVDELEDDENELEHSSIQEKLDKELKELDKTLEQKEVKFALSSCLVIYILTVVFVVFRVLNC